MDNEIKCYCWCPEILSGWCLSNHRHCKPYKERKWEEYMELMKKMR